MTSTFLTEADRRLQEGDILASYAVATFIWSISLIWFVWFILLIWFV